MLLPVASFCHPPTPQLDKDTQAKAGTWLPRVKLGLTLIALAALCACQAPGMKMTMRPNKHETPVEVDGLQVSLHPVTSQLLSTLAARKTAEEIDLDGLVTEKIQAYRIGPQDVLLITVWDHPEISLPMGPNRQDSSYGNLVDEGGSIFFPYVGTLKVSGLTTSQVRETLVTQLAKTIRNPQVDVKVLIFRSQKVYVGGEVRNPTVYAVTDVPFTLVEAVNRAGGFLPTADDSRMVLTRGTKSWMLNFPKVLAAGSRLGQILLQDGDTLQVPNISEEPVYVMGELFKPGNVPLIHGNLSLAKAISEAGGIQVATADATSIYVIRAAGAPNAVDVFHLDGRNPASMVLADKFTLNPHDIVYVDAGTLVRFNRVMSLILPTFDSAVNSGLAAMEARYFSRLH